MAAVDLTDQDFVEQVRAAGSAVVDFHVGGSAECILFKAVFKRLSADFPHVRFFVLDAEDAPSVTRAFQIGGLPFAAAFRDGAWVDGCTHADEQRFREFLAEHFGS